ncbi:GNAT family N-acetyltransferase [Alkaliphilus transvaalensis]|uniref:GNAT family N-acetyltransferase n=1 Tax=Alkaliphilus transvaalensis TaxID=114628 RepID=UPI001FA7D278|nr:GNAT family N-acetyltransferase [Alkaliphilus transvaalensis]
MVIRGKNTYITKLKREHVDEMQFWGAHEDPLFYSYTFPKMNKKEKDYWYAIKRHSLKRKSFAIYNESNILVGYISLRNIKWFRKISELGIVFDPNHINKGYGTDSLKSFIRYYFEEMKMKRLDLKVAEFNTRAYRCYIKCGFFDNGIELDEFEDQGLAIYEDEKLKEYQTYFKKVGDILKCRFIKMSITREIYEQNKESYPHYPPNTCA